MAVTGHGARGPARAGGRRAARSTGLEVLGRSVDFPISPRSTAPSSCSSTGTCGSGAAARWRSRGCGTRWCRRSATSSTSATSSWWTRRSSPARSARRRATSSPPTTSTSGKAYLAQTGPALRRGGGGGARQGLLLRPHVPRREVEDAPAPHRVLDGGAGGGVQRLERQHAAAGRVRELHRGARARALRGAAQGTGARHRAARAGDGAVPADQLHRRGGDAQPARLATCSGATTSAATTRRCWRSSTTARSSSSTIRRR